MKNFNGSFFDFYIILLYNNYIERKWKKCMIYLLLEICARYEDIPETSLDDFFRQTEDHANFLLDSIKVKE